MYSLFFLIGCLFGILAYIYLPKLLSKFFEIVGKQYEVTFTIMYFYHPTETSKKGQYIRMKPISIRLNASNEEEASKFANDIVRDNLKIEIDSIEEKDGSQ